jgi:hypothetical protein
MTVCLVMLSAIQTIWDLIQGSLVNNEHRRLWKWSGPNRHYPCVCTDGKDKTTWNFNSEAFHTVHACSQSLLFLPTKCTYYCNTYIYHHLPPTYFGVCYTIFSENTALLAQKLYAFCNAAIKCTIYCFFKFTMLSLCLKHYVFHSFLYSKS